MDGLFVGFDIGTQGTKGIVLDAATGEILARAGAAYDLIQGLPPGAAEQDPETWIDAIRTIARTLFSTPGVDPARVRGVGVSGQQHGLVVLDETDRVVRPAKLWCDTTTVAEAEEITRKTGRATPCGFTAPKMLWMRRREPENWARVRSVLLPHDYVNFRLTGRKTMECGDASGSGLFDPETRAFDARAIAAVDLRLNGMLPPLIGAGEPAGELSAEGAVILGVPKGTLVSAGGGDNMMSAIGAGAVRDGVVVMSLGTSGTVFCRSSKPIVDPEGAIAPFCDSAGAWLPLLCTMNVTGVTEEIKDAFGMDHAALTRAASEVPPGANGLLFLPYLAGERVPNLPHATGAITGIRPGSLTPGALYRAAIEGTTLLLGWGVDRLTRLGVSPSAVRLVGGGAKNALWRTIAANVLEVPITVLAEPESGALGGAIQAIWTAERALDGAVTIAEVADRYVHTTGDVILPDPGTFDVYRRMKGELVAKTKLLY